MKLALKLAGLSLAVTALAHSADAAAYSQIIAFGDSLSDNGNLFALTGKPPAPYYQGRFSNGPVAVEVMADSMGLSLTDYAYGGAQTGTGNVSGAALNGTGIQAQIAKYGQGLSAAGKTADASALYLVWGGPNDFFAGTNMVSPTTATTAAGNLKADITSLYNLGARDFFVPLMPDLGLTPSARAANASIPGYSAIATADTVSFNSLLTANIQDLVASLDGIHIQIFDTYSLQHKGLTTAKLLGYNTTDPCVTTTSVCANPDKYLFWDGVHPTAVQHEILGMAFADAAAVPEPGTWAMLAAGVLALLVMSTRQRRLQGQQPAAATAALRA